MDNHYDNLWVNRLGLNIEGCQSKIKGRFVLASAFISLDLVNYSIGVFYVSEGKH